MGVGEELVYRVALAVAAGVVAQAEDGYVPHAGHDAAEGAHRGEYPAHPDGPQQAPHIVGRRCAGNAQKAGLLAPLGHALGHGFVGFVREFVIGQALFDGLLELARHVLADHGGLLLPGRGYGCFLGQAPGGGHRGHQAQNA